MRKTAAGLIMALLITAVAGTFLVGLGKANPILIKPIYAEISVQHPQEKTYSISVVALNFTVKTNSDPSLITYGYLLDGKVNGTVDQINITGTEITYDDQPTWTGDKPTDYYYWPYAEYTLEGEAVLSGLSDGVHNITVYQGSIDDFLLSNTVSFIIDTTPEDDAQSEPSVLISIAPIAVSTVAVVILSVVLLVYYRRKRRKEAERT